MTLTKAASAIIECRGRLLFVRSKRTRERWAYPGGSLEEGESSQGAAVRETREEVGLDITITERLGSYVIPYPTGGFEIECFAGVALNQDIRVDPEEILEARWLSVEDGRKLDLTSTAREALEAYVGRANQEAQ